MRVLLLVFSLLFWSWVAISSVLMFLTALVIWLVTIPFDRRLRILHLFTSFWGVMYLWTNPLWPLRVEGREHIDRSQVYVMVSNHQSILDILVLHALFVHFKWVSKKENAWIPLIGWNVVLNGYVLFDRGSRGGSLKMMRDCRAHLSRGSSLMIFPEGTRSLDGKLRPFKEGAFRLALQEGVPILPIVLEGTGESLPKQGFILRKKTRIRLRVLPPIPPASFVSEVPSEVAQQVRDALNAELARLRSED
jgi:1-acyl-sn-glycerol-3-phosphate acyltransferase